MINFNIVHTFITDSSKDTYQENKWTEDKLNEQIIQDNIIWATSLFLQAS